MPNFYNHLAWIENTQQYQSIYNASLDRALTDKCRVCGSALLAGKLLALSHSMAIHEKCYEELLGKLSGLKSEASARKIFESAPVTLCVFRLINTYWRDYPPDWEARTKDIRQLAQGICENCGDDQSILDVHHIRPISDGGSHAYDNLICVCRPCHEEHHGNRTLEQKDSTWKRKPYFHAKVELIKKAIDDRKDIQFDYINRQGIRTYARVATPKN
jgi:hypothetical protein